MSIRSNLTSLPEKYFEKFSEFDISRAVKEVENVVRSTRNCFNETQPWISQGSPDNKKERNEVLYLSLETMRISALLLLPVVPEASHNVLDSLRIPPSLRNFDQLDVGFDYAGKECKEWEKESRLMTDENGNEVWRGGKKVLFRRLQLTELE